MVLAFEASPLSAPTSGCSAAPAVADRSFALAFCCVDVGGGGSSDEGAAPPARWHPDFGGGLFMTLSHSSKPEVQLRKSTRKCRVCYCTDSFLVRG
jgi:hypothetical protein